MADGKLHVNEHEEGAGACRKALALLSAMDRTEAELREKLRRNGFSDEAAGEAVSYVKKLHYLDDERYAAGYLRERTRKGYGPRRSRYELQRRGIPDEILEEAAENVSEEDEEESAYSVGRKVWRKTVSMEWKKRCAKLYATLTQRGFGYETVDRVMRRLAREEAEEEDSDGFYD